MYLQHSQFQTGNGLVPTLQGIDAVLDVVGLVLIFHKLNVQTRPAFACRI